MEGYETKHPLNKIGDLEWRCQQIPQEREEEFLRHLEMGFLILESKLDSFGPVYWHENFNNKENPLRGAAEKFLKHWKQKPDYWHKTPLTVDKIPRKAKSIEELFINHGSWVMKILLGGRVFHMCVEESLRQKPYNEQEIVENSQNSEDSPLEEMMNKEEKRQQLQKLSQALEKLYKIKCLLQERSCSTMALLWRDDVDPWLKSLLPATPEEYQDEWQQVARNILNENTSLSAAYQDLIETTENSANIKQSRLRSLAAWRYLVLFLNLHIPEATEQIMFQCCSDIYPFWNGRNRLPKNVKEEIMGILDEIIAHHPPESYWERFKESEEKNEAEIECLFTILLLFSPMIKGRKLLWKQLGLKSLPDIEEMPEWQLDAELKKTIQRKAAEQKKTKKSMKKDKNETPLLSKANLIAFVEESLPEGEMEQIDRALFLSENKSARHFVHRMSIEHRVDTAHPQRLWAFSSAFRKNPAFVPHVYIRSEKMDELLYVKADADTQNIGRRQESVLEMGLPIEVLIDSPKPGLVITFWEDMGGQLACPPPFWSDNLSNWRFLREDRKPVVMEEGEFWARLYLMVFDKPIMLFSDMPRDAELLFTDLMEKARTIPGAWVQKFVLLGK